MKTILMMIVSLMLIGCGDYTVIKDNGNDNSDHSYTVNLDGNATYTNDGTGKDDPYFGDVKFDPSYNKSECNAAGYFFCDVTQKCINQPLKGGSCSANTPKYNPNYTQAECTEAGFFYCTIEQKCLNKPLQGGTCSGK